MSHLTQWHSTAFSGGEVQFQERVTSWLKDSLRRASVRDILKAASAVACPYGIDLKEFQKGLGEIAAETIVPGWMAKHRDDPLLMDKFYLEGCKGIPFSLQYVSNTDEKQFRVYASLGSSNPFAHENAGTILILAAEGWPKYLKSLASDAERESAIMYKDWLDQSLTACTKDEELTDFDVYIPDLAGKATWRRRRALNEEAAEVVVPLFIEKKRKNPRFSASFDKIKSENVFSLQSYEDPDGKSYLCVDSLVSKQDPCYLDREIGEARLRFPAIYTEVYDGDA